MEKNNPAATAPDGPEDRPGTPVQPFATLAELRDALHDLNYEHETSTAAVVINGTVHLAYCTDPDGEWFLENGDPRERMVEEDGWRHYERLSLDAFPRGPYTIIWPPAD